jgi:hypothetical protein
MANHKKGKAKKPQKNNNNKQPGKQPGKKNEVKRPSAEGMLAQCSKEYLSLQLNPFVASHSSCLPVPPSLPTQKLTTVVRGTFEIGTLGFGFVTARPVHAVANDDDAVYYSLGAYTGSTVVASGTGVVAAASNSPYVAADFGSADTELQYRTVSSGLRVRYTGSELNRGGVVLPYCQPEHASLNSAGTSDVLGDITVSTVPVDRRWHACYWTPGATANEYTFSGSLSDAAMPMAVMVVGEAENTFEFEFYTHFEITGRKASLSYSPSHSDSQGFGYVQQVTNSPIARRLASEGSKSVISWAWRALNAAATYTYGVPRIEPELLTNFAHNDL